VLSRPSPPSLSSADEQEIARALTGGPGPGVAFERLVSLERRTLAVNAAWSPAPELTWPRFEEVVARRADATGHRLLPVVGSGDFDGTHWVAYEVGSAVSLAAHVGERWPAGSALNLMSDVGHALDEAASGGLLPWELAPASIFVDSRFGVLLTDLGTVREALAETGLEEGGGLAFVPPEVRRGEGAGDRSGVFVCGALLYELLTGEAPRPGVIARIRPDLSEDIDLVLARATARDSLERYRDAAELSQSARRALLDDLAEPEADGLPTSDVPPVEDAPPSFRDVVEDAPPSFRDVVEDDERVFELAGAPVDYDWDLPPASRSLKLAAVAGVVLALGLGAAAGFALGGDDPKPPSPLTFAGGSGMVVTLPPGWSAGQEDRSDITAYPASDGFSGLTVNLDESAAEIEVRDDPVRLGRIDAWRDTSAAPAAVRYFAPTSAGGLTITCEASPGAARGTLRLCERAASTLDLGAVRVLPLPGVIEQPGIRAAVARLARDRTAGRRRLAGARRPSGQREVANALVRAYDRAARRLGDVPGAEEMAAAARRSAAAYRSLARAAGGRSSRPWNRAREAVRRADAALADAIAAHNAAP
jgi:hypothetical protein